MTIDLKMEGALKLSQQLRALALSRQDKRKLHLWIAHAIARRLKKAIREFVGDSPVELFDGSPVNRRRAARFFASQVGRRASADSAVIFDRRAGKITRPRRDDRATTEQAARLKELGFRKSRAWIQQHFDFKLAGLVIRKMETAAGVTDARRKRRGLGLGKSGRRGSLLLLVWREQGADIVAAVDIVGIIQRFLKAQLAAA